MNVFKRELKAGLKPFVLWMIALFILVFAGTIKFTGIESGGAAMTQLFDSIPPIVLAVLGMSGTDVSNFGGYYAFLFNYSVIIAAIYAVYLGRNAVSREIIDKTSEFLFLKPRARSFFLGVKLSAGVVLLAGFSLMNFIFSVLSYVMLNLPDDMTKMMVLYSVALFLVSCVFLSLGALFSALFANPEKGARWGSVSVLVCYVIGVACDMMNANTPLRILSPFRYFEASSVLSGTLDPLYIGLCGAVVGVSLVIAFKKFEHRDLAVS